MKALLWVGEAVVRDVSVPPIPRGWVLGRVLAASLSSIDAAVTSGTIPVLPGRVLGSYGVIRVVEPGVDSGFGPGEVLGVVSLSKGGFLGLDIDGLMREYASVPKECLRRVINVEQSKLWLYPLMLEFSFIPALRDGVVGKDVLVMGTGISTYVIASYLRGDSRVSVLGDSSSLVKKLAGLGVKVVSTKKAAELYGAFDAVVLCAMSSYLIMISPRFVGDGGLLIIPPNTYVGKLVFDDPLALTRVTLWRPPHAGIGEGADVVGVVDEGFLKSIVAVTNDLSEAAVLRRHYARVIYVSA